MLPAKPFKRLQALVFVIWRWPRRSRNLVGLKTRELPAREFWNCNRPSVTARNFAMSEPCHRSPRISARHSASPGCRNSLVRTTSAIGPKQTS